MRLSKDGSLALLSALTAPRRSLRGKQPRDQSTNMLPMAGGSPLSMLQSGRIPAVVKVPTSTTTTKSSP